MDKEIKEFLRELENRLIKTCEVIVSEEIRKFIDERYKDKEVPQILKWEQISFDFVETNEKTEWGIYFGPIIKWVDKEGKIWEYPSIQLITCEVLSYWEKRVEESTNLVFKQRYCNLIWEFSEKIKGEKPHYTIAQIFIDSILEIVKKDLYTYEIYLLKNKLKRALSLALTINDEERIKKLKEEIIKYEQKIAKDELPGTWGYSYELLIKNENIELTEEEEKMIIENLEERMERLLRKKDHFSAEHAVKSLVDYYKNKDFTKAKSIIFKYGKTVENEAERVNPLIGSNWLEKLHLLYHQFGLKEEAQGILIKIRNISKNIPSELKKIEVSTEISKEEVENFINNLIEGDLKTVLQKIATCYIPKKDEVIKQLQKLRDISPLSFLFHHRTVDKEGRIVATIGPLEEDMEGNIVLQISQNISFLSFFLRETIDRFIRKFNVTVENIISYLYTSPIFEEERKKFFTIGLNAYLKNQYEIVLHILVPHIEATVRRLAELIGIPVIKYRNDLSRYDYKTLDELLREENIKKVLGENLTFYLRIVYTDQRGFNLRNRIAHGLILPEDCNSLYSDIVFHTLLCLGLVRENENNET